MSLTQAVHLVLYEGAGAQPLPAETRLATLTALLERGYAITSTKVDVSLVPEGHTNVMVLGQFAGGTPRDQQATLAVTMRFHDITGLDAIQVATEVETFRAETSSPKHGDWKPWFPVIDYDR